MGISALDKGTIKQITTTQVITSVLSVVKELVENALDGGANHVEVYLEDKGLGFIEVKDNGGGICKTDSVSMALPSHTSKISNMSDLETLETYGFRGEALNAICKVSDVKIITRTHEDDHARSYILSHDGNIEKAEFCNRAIGTTVQVRSLFRNFPVRRQMISNKRQATETVKSIENLLQDFGLCLPTLRINYRVDDITVFSKVPAETDDQNLSSVFGRNFAAQYQRLNFNELDSTGVLTVPKKDLADLSSISQIIYSHIFVNGRPVTLKEFEKAIMKVISVHFESKISTRKKPAFFLNLIVSPSSVDVNLEPNKTSVLLVNHSKILSTTTKLLSNYYEIPLEPEEASLDPSPALDDSQASEADVHSPTPKKPRVEKREKSPGLRNTENKENETRNTELPGALLQGEPRSQLPEVDLGEDFNTQDIEALPTLDEDQLKALEKVFTSPEVGQITASQWSKGQIPFALPGKTDVSIVNICQSPQTSRNSSSNPEANKNGFLKFSKEMRPKLIRENRDMNLVQIAKLLTEEWKSLGPEGRERYRELGMQDESLSRTRQSPSGQRPQKAKESLADKKRLLKLLENMKEAPKGKPNVLGRTVIPWGINMQTMLQAFRGRRAGGSNLVVGALEDDVWIVRTNSQLWCLHVEKLFQGLQVEEQESQKTPEFIEQCLQRWLREKDSMDLMHPIFEFSELKDRN